MRVARGPGVELLGRNKGRLWPPQAKHMPTSPPVAAAATAVALCTVGRFKPRRPVRTLRKLAAWNRMPCPLLLISKNATQAATKRTGGPMQIQAHVKGLVRLVVCLVEPTPPLGCAAVAQSARIHRRRVCQRHVQVRPHWRHSNHGNHSSHHRYLPTPLTPACLKIRR